jgi:hypothetical protein
VAVVQAIQKSTASNHSELCQYLSRQFSTDPTIAQLHAFSRLADAGMAAMAHVAGVLYGQPEVALNAVVLHKNAASLCQELREASMAWLAAPPIALRHMDTARRFAETMTVDQPTECFRKLLLHHETYGGGLRWFVLHNERIEARNPPASSVASYGFRLWPLCRLAAQCGVLATMPKALLDASAYQEDDDE